MLSPLFRELLVLLDLGDHILHVRLHRAVRIALEVVLESFTRPGCLPLPQQGVRKYHLNPAVFFIQLDGLAGICLGAIESVESERYLRQFELRVRVCGVKFGESGEWLFCLVRTGGHGEQYSEQVLRLRKLVLDLDAFAQGNFGVRTATWFQLREREQVISLRISREELDRFLKMGCRPSEIVLVDRVLGECKLSFCFIGYRGYSGIRRTRWSGVASRRRCTRQGPQGDRFESGAWVRAYMHATIHRTKPGLRHPVLDDDARRPGIKVAVSIGGRKGTPRRLAVAPQFHSD